MNQAHFLTLLGQYNQWMNRKLYDAAAKLSEEQLQRDVGAFFKSIIGTLNHLVVADTVWLQRFSRHPSSKLALVEIEGLPKPTQLDQILFGDLTGLAERRQLLDNSINQWLANLTQNNLESSLNYQSMAGVPGSKSLGSLLLHFFNHQTHHRGQLSVMLSQFGIDIGVTDLLAIVPDNQ